MLVAVGACGLPTAGEFASGSVTVAHDAHDAAPASKEPPPDSSTPDRGSVVRPPPPDAAPDVSAPLPITNLLAQNNADFEAPCSDGNGFYRASLEPSDVEHSGAHSCAVCRAADQPDAEIWSIDNGVSVSPTAGQEYRATVWVRRPPGSTDAIELALTVRTHAVNDYQAIDTQTSSSVIANDEWQLLSVTLPLTSPAAQMDTYVWARNDAAFTTPCFLVDDYVLWRSN
jgi:hypothetical protein